MTESVPGARKCVTDDTLLEPTTSLWSWICQTLRKQDKK